MMGARFIAVLLGVLAVAARAQEGPMGALLSGPETNFLGYRLEATPGVSGTPAIVHQREDGRVVVASGTADVWTLTERVGYLGLNGDVAIPGGPVVPRSLWSVEGGGRFSRKLERGRALGLNLGIGSDSDAPFDGLRETSFRAGVDYQVPSGERNAWLFFLSYSNNRYFFNGAPLPGVGYRFRSESGKVRGIVGFPFAALMVKPAPNWDARFSLFGFRRISADVGDRIDGVRLHAGFDWGGQTWLRSGRADRKSVLNYERKRLYAGVEAPPIFGTTAGVSAGREFDRLFYETSHQLRSGDSRAALRPAWYAEGSLSRRF